jgi:hypothetical protein
MTTTPQLGLGTQYWVETAAGSGVYFRVAKVMDIQPPNPQLDEHDITNMDSVAKESLAGLPDYGETSIPMLYSEDSDTDAFLLDWITTRETRGNRLVYPSGSQDDWQGWPKGYQPNLPVNGVCQATLTVRNTGKPVRTSA